MRQVFSSPRLENVERVAQLLEEAGVQTRLTHGRSYRGGLRGNFSYREGADAKPVPAVWVVRSEDQPRARALLRELGLLDSTRGDTGYRLPTFRSETAEAPADARSEETPAGKGVSGRVDRGGRRIIKKKKKR